MAYQALYRKWRPHDFSHMVAQETVIATLRNQIMTGHIAHAYLFCGSRGTGKTSTAKIMSRAINCENPINGDPCGICPSCVRLAGDESLDVIEIDAASNNGVNEMRDLRETVKYPPQYGKYKVYIIDEVHMLSVSAFNALLKTLEEPPAHVVFILATTEPQKLPSTILSRCQRYDFGRIPASQICHRLREAAVDSEVQASDEALMMIARAAEGGMRDALSILDMCIGYGKTVDEDLVRRVLGTSDRSFLFRFGQQLAAENPGELLKMIDELMRSGKEPAVFAKDISTHMRSLLTAKCCPDEIEELLDITEEDARDYREQAASFTITRMMRILDLYMAVETELRYASTPRIAIETATMKACLKTGDVDGQAVNDRFSQLEKEIHDLKQLMESGAAIQSVKNTAAIENRTEHEAAPQPEQKSMTPMGQGTDAVWKNMTDRLRREDLSTWTMLLNGKYTCKDGAHYVWQCTKENIYGLKIEPKKELIARLLTECAGTECSFDVTYMSPDDHKNSGSNADRLLNDITSTFGAANVIVQ